MNTRFLSLAVLASLFFAVAAYADDVPAPAAPAAASEAKTEAKPEVKPEAKPEVPAEKPLGPSVVKFQPVVDSYQKAHDDLLAWLKKASSKMEAVDDKIADLKGKLAVKGASDTEKRLAAMQKKEPIPEIKDPEVLALMAELQTQQARQKELGEALAKAVEQKVQESNRAVLDALPKSSGEGN